MERGVAILSPCGTGVNAGRRFHEARCPFGQRPVRDRSRAPDEPVLLTAPTPWGVRLTLNRPASLNALSGALVAALDAAMADTPEQRGWDTILRRDGLKAALAWRDRRYDERLAENRRGAQGQPSAAQTRVTCETRATYPAEQWTPSAGERSARTTTEA